MTACVEQSRRPVEDDSWIQATLAVPAAGLGLREATALTLKAFIASRVAARAPVMLMAAHAEKAGVFSRATFEQHYDNRTNGAVDSWLLELPEDLRETVRDAVADAARQGQSWWNAVTESTGDPDGLANDDEENVELEPREGPTLVLAIGAEDGEHPNAQGGRPAFRALLHTHQHAV